MSGTTFYWLSAMPVSGAGPSCGVQATASNKPTSEINLNMDDPQIIVFCYCQSVPQNPSTTAPDYIK